MGKRVGVLLGLLIFRLVIGMVMLPSCKGMMKVRGNVIKIEQKGSEEIWHVEPYDASFRVGEGRIKGVDKGDLVAISGSCEAGVIDMIFGRLRLINPALLEVSQVNQPESFLVKGVSGFRELVLRVYRKQLPEPEAGLVAGIVLGVKSNLERSFYDALIETGTVHIVVASGYNVAVVGMILFELFLYVFVRKWATLSAIGAMVLYGMLAGGDPPVVRSVVMGSIVFLSQSWGRVGSGLWLLFVACWLMVMANPEVLLSISFQLSVGATLGLMIVDPFLRSRIEGIKSRVVEVILGSELLPTVSAQITTGPIILFYFGRVSLISPLVNVMVLPLIPLGMALGAAQGLLGLIYLPLGRVVAPFTYGVMHLVVVIIKAFA